MVDGDVGEHNVFGLARKTKRSLWIMTRHAAVFLAIALSSAFGQSGGKRIDARRFWNDHDLSDWATPIAGLNVRPGHYSEKEYYSAPVGELVRTYQVYFPGREPARYWNMLR